MFQGSNWRRFLPVVLVMGGIFFLSHQPGNTITLPDIVNIDKVLHALVYATLGLAALYSLSPSWRRRRPGASACVLIVFCLCFGVSDEFHQSFVPGRSVSGGDVIADTVGGVLALAGDWGWRRYRSGLRNTN
jgi:VanZ family protein